MRSISTSTSGVRLYLDTNIYLDHVLNRPGKSSQLLTAIAQGQFEGITSYLTIAEIAGVLKAEGIPISQITSLLQRMERWPNIRIIFWHPSMDRQTPTEILSTCAQTRDALHFVVAKFMAADKIVTRDGGFTAAVQSVIPCVVPEDLLP